MSRWASSGKEVISIVGRVRGLPIGVSGFKLVFVVGEIGRWEIEGPAPGVDVME